MSNQAFAPQPKKRNDDEFPKGRSQPIKRTDNYNAFVVTAPSKAKKSMEGMEQTSVDPAKLNVILAAVNDKIELVSKNGKILSEKDGTKFARVASKMIEEFPENVLA